jgi:hypothetical protein
LFDHATLTNSSGYTGGYNAYITGCQRLQPAQTSDRILSASPSYQVGPLGAYYQLTNSVLTNGVLINADQTTTAGQVALYDYTVTPNFVNGNQIKETNSPVDIGYHYVAVNSAGQPLGLYNNGIADYLQTSSQDLLPDWWEWEYFGNLDQTATMSYDADGNDNLIDYLNGTDPNVITFTLAFPGDHFPTNMVSGQITVVAGVPSYAAVLVDSTNFAGAAWSPYSPTVSAYLGTTQGWHNVWVGLRGLPANAWQTWHWRRLKLDTTPPQLCITTPTTNSTSQPILQLAGYCPEDLSSLTYDLNNTNGLVTNQLALIVNRTYDGTAWEFTTNAFQCFDVPLALGANTITLHATDLAGNVTVTNLPFTFSTNGVTNPPAITLYYPLNGQQLSGSNLTWRGLLGDPTASITAQAVGAGGTTNILAGWVERAGLFWVDGLPLLPGTNLLTLTATDFAGNSSVTNITVVQSDVLLTIDDFSDQDLTTGAVNLTGYVSTGGYTIWANGVQAAQAANGDGSASWAASGVPLPWGGRVVVQALAIPSTGSGSNGGGGQPTLQNLANPASAAGVSTEVEQDQPFRAAYVQSYTNLSININHVAPAGLASWDTFLTQTNGLTWADGQGGQQTLLQTFGPWGYDDVCTTVTTWPPSRWEQLPYGTCQTTCLVQGGGSGPAAPPYIPYEHLDYHVPLWGPPPTGPAN